MRASRLPDVSRFFLRIFFVALPAGPVAAQAEAAAQLPAVTVTAAPDPVTTAPTPTAARAAQRDIPGGVSVLDSADFRSGRAATAEDALRFAPGVFAVSRFGSEEARLSIRGSGLQRTFHGRGVLLLQDGVPLNLADGSVDFQALEPLALQYIEVFRGANARQYGGTALGGAINHVSPTGADAEPALRLEAGSFGHARAYAQWAAAGEQGDVFLSASHYGRDGFQAHSRQDTQRFFANAGYRFSDTLEQRLYLALVHSESELPGALTAAELRRGERRRAAPGNVSDDYQRNFDLGRLAWRLGWQPVAQQQLAVTAFYSDRSLFHPIFQVLEQDSADYGADLRWQHAAPFGRAADTLVLGWRQQQGRIAEDRFVNLSGQRGMRTDRSRQQAENRDLYGEYRLGLAPGWRVIAGLQAVSAERRFQDRFVAGTAADPADKSFARRYRELLPRLGLLHTPHARLQLFANLSEVFEPPSFGELSGGPDVTPLAAQTGSSLELGARGEWVGKEARALAWELALYRLALEDELISYQVAPAAVSTGNADRTLHQGVELGLAATLAAHWQARLAWQLNDFRFQRDTAYGDNAIAGVPAQLLSAELRYRPGAQALYIAPLLTAASASWVDHLNRVQAPGYVVYGLRLGQEVTPQLSWFLEGRNLTDKAYAATHNVVVDATALAFGQPQRLYNPGDGRALYAGIDWRFR